MDLAYQMRVHSFAGAQILILSARQVVFRRDGAEPFSVEAVRRSLVLGDGGLRGERARLYTKCPVRIDPGFSQQAKVNKATTVYSNDKYVRRWAEELGMKGIAVWDLESPPPSQSEIEFGDSDARNEPESETEGDTDVEQEEIPENESEV